MFNNNARLLEADDYFRDPNRARWLVTCPRCEEVFEEGYEPDGCHDFHCPMLEPACEP